MWTSIHVISPSKKRINQLNVNPIQITFERIDNQREKVLWQRCWFFLHSILVLAILNKNDIQFTVLLIRKLGHINFSWEDNQAKLKDDDDFLNSRILPSIFCFALETCNLIFFASEKAWLSGRNVFSCFFVSFGWLCGNSWSVFNSFA